MKKLDHRRIGSQSRSLKGWLARSALNKRALVTTRPMQPAASTTEGRPEVAKSPGSQATLKDGHSVKLEGQGAMKLSGQKN